MNEIIESNIARIKDKRKYGKPLTTGDYQAAAILFMNKQLDYDERLLDCVLGLAGEVGEVVDFVKKVYFQGHKMDVSKIGEELGDVLWYAFNLADELKLNVADIMVANLLKLHKRYPNGFESEKSINRE